MRVLIGIICIIISFGIYPIYTNEKANGDKIKEANLDNKEKEQEMNLIDEIEEYLQSQNLSKERIAVYISSFDGRDVYSFHEDTDFIAASLYKVPLAMIYYELILQGVYNEDDLFLYESYHYEAGGPIGDNYMPGTYFTLSDLLHYLILNSDNTAGHILFENLGGWVSFKNLCEKYGQVDHSETFYSYDNVFTANYLHDCLNYLYLHKNSFDLLIQDMENTFKQDYLNRYVPKKIAQKYGSYEDALNIMGFVETKRSYSIVILSNYGYNFKEHMGRINEICYRYFSMG